jgi:hypothetical protein
MEFPRLQELSLFLQDSVSAHDDVAQCLLALVPKLPESMTTFRVRDLSSNAWIDVMNATVAHCPDLRVLDMGLYRLRHSVGEGFGICTLTCVCCGLG